MKSVPKKEREIKSKPGKETNPACLHTDWRCICYVFNVLVTVPPLSMLIIY